MPLRVEFHIGMRHMRSRRKPAFVSLTAWISVLGIALGVATLIVVIGVMAGFERELRDRILGTQSHIVVTEPGPGVMEAWRRVLAQVKEHPGVAAASPFVFGQALLTSRGRVVGSIVRGIDPAQETAVTDIRGYVEAAVLERFVAGGAPASGGAQVLLGAELAASLQVGVGDEVSVVSPAGVVTPMGMLPRSKSFQVAGVFRSGFYQYDAGLAFITLREAQNFFNLGTGVTGVHARVRDIFEAERISRELQRTLTSQFWARSWQQMNRNLFSALKTEKITMTILLLLVIVVAAFNIVGSLVMVVMEKGKEIAILKSMGATPGSILRIFFLQGAFVGVGGACLGVAGGLALGWNLHYVEDFLEKVFGLDILPPSIYHISRLPVHMTAQDVSLTALMAVLISL
ncbi:MAG: lipoprotein-releasing ABC transporter permease subunit, partial [Nitrospinota bacterium]